MKDNEPHGGTFKPRCVNKGKCICGEIDPTTRRAVVLCLAIPTHLPDRPLFAYLPLSCSARSIRSTSIFASKDLLCTSHPFYIHRHSPSRLLFISSFLFFPLPFIRVKCCSFVFLVGTHFSAGYFQLTSLLITRGLVLCSSLRRGLSSLLLASF